jgi:hypothetical protein
MHELRQEFGVAFVGDYKVGILIHQLKDILILLLVVLVNSFYCDLRETQQSCELILIVFEIIFFVEIG